MLMLEPASILTLESFRRLPPIVHKGNPGRNPSEAGRAAAQALRVGYRALYEMNEYAHDLADKDLKGLLVQATGLEPGSSTVKVMLGSFKSLKQFANFDEFAAEKPSEEERLQEKPEPLAHREMQTRLGLSYTINLNLPATSDIAVFNAIFKSLREHLLR